MKNLKLAHKMLVLTVLLMASVLVVAYVAVNRLDAVNAQIHELVDGTMLKSKLASDLQLKLLNSLRAQKNSILARDDERSKEFAAASRTGLTEARVLFDKLRGLITQGQAEGQLAAVEALGKAIDAFEKVNNDAPDLSVQNTNVKARKLLAGDVQRQMNILAAHFQKWVAAATAKGSTEASQVARLKTLYEINTALLELHPNTIKHIESSNDEELSLEMNVRNGSANSTSFSPRKRRPAATSVRPRTRAGSGGFWVSQSPAWYWEVLSPPS